MIKKFSQYYVLFFFTISCSGMELSIQLAALKEIKWAESFITNWNGCYQYSLDKEKGKENYKLYLAQDLPKKCKEIQAHLEASGDVFFVKNFNKQVVAIAGIQSKELSKSIDVTKIQSLRLYVHPAYVNRKIVSLIFHKIMESSLVDKLIIGLDITAGNSIDFYKRLGFKTLPLSNPAREIMLVKNFPKAKL